MLHSEAHLLRPQLGYCQVLARQILLREFLCEILLIDGEKLRGRQRQESHDGVVQLAGELGIVLRAGAPGFRSGISFSWNSTSSIFCLVAGTILHLGAETLVSISWPRAAH